LLIGGSGPRRTLPLVARFADTWNAYGTPEEIAASAALLDERCREVGREGSSIERSATLNVVIRRTRRQAETDFAEIVRLNRPQPDERELGAGCTPAEVAEVAEVLGRYAAVGIAHLMWVMRPPWDIETIRHVDEVRALL